MNAMIFWGATGQAKVLRECMAAQNLTLAALFDANAALRSPFADVPLHVGKRGFERWIKARTEEEPLGFLVAIGGDKGRERVEMQQYLESFGLVALRAIHPTAFVAGDARIGPGSQILAGAAALSTRMRAWTMNAASATAFTSGRARTWRAACALKIMRPWARGPSCCRAARLGRGRLSARGP